MPKKLKTIAHETKKNYAVHLTKTTSTVFAIVLLLTTMSCYIRVTIRSDDMVESVKQYLYNALSM